MALAGGTVAETIADSAITLGVGGTGGIGTAETQFDGFIHMSGCVNGGLGIAVMACGTAKVRCALGMLDMVTGS